MFQLKSISKAGIPEALQKAQRYRLLNEPRLAESICEDILQIEPDNHEAIVIMLLAITDQFGGHRMSDQKKAKQLLTGLSEYEQFYYSGIICERQGIAILTKGVTGGDYTAYEWLISAMEYFEKAEAIRPQGNDDAILRWNTCARLIMNYQLHPRPESQFDLPLE